MRLLPVLAALAACSQTLPSSSLGDDARLVFRDFDEDPKALPEVVARMDEALAALDLEGPRRDRTFDVPELTEDFFGGATVPDDLDTTAQLRMSMAALATHGLADTLSAQVEVDQTCINARAVRCQERASIDDTDGACLVDGTCDVYRTLQTLRIQTLPVDFWLQAPMDFRRITLPDGREAVVSRSWLEEEYPNDNGNHSWRQRFGLDIFTEDPDDADRTRRYYATWVGPRLGGVPGYLVFRALLGGLEGGFTHPDAWLDDPGCDVDLDTCLADAPF